MDKRRTMASEEVRRHKLRQHAASLATGVVVFLAAIGLMQAVKPSADGGRAAVVKNLSPEPRAGGYSGSSGAGATAAGVEEETPAAAPPASRPAARGERVARASPDTAAQIMGMPSVYIHVLNESARDQARRLAPALERKGIALAGIKVVGAGPRASDLRYFRPSEKEEAARVQAALLSLGLPARQLKSISGYETSAVPRQYELWLVSDYKG
jgi:hypothetical protein